MDLLRGFVRRPEFGSLIGFLAVGALFTALSPNFLTVESVRGITRTVAELGIVACGVTALAIAGEFDLSVGAILGLSSFLYPFFVNQGLPPAAGIALAIGLAGCMGLVNGILVVRVGISSFVATLATMLLWRGILLALSGGFALGVRPGGAVGELFSGTLPGGFPISVIWFALVVLTLSVLLLRTRFGNWAYATGGNRQAARALGVSTGRVKITMFVLVGVLTGLVGVIQVGRFQSVDPLRGQGVELQAITTAVIGGTLLTGGYGSIVGTVLGTFIVGMVQTGLVLAGAPPYYFSAFIGIVLVIAVVINMRVQRFAQARA